MGRGPRRVGNPCLEEMEEGEGRMEEGIPLVHAYFGGSRREYVFHFPASTRTKVGGGGETKKQE